MRACKTKERENIGRSPKVRIKYGVDIYKEEGRK
jgi:hypothetical protein